MRAAVEEGVPEQGGQLLQNARSSPGHSGCSARVSQQRRQVDQQGVHLPVLHLHRLDAGLSYCRTADP
ncbi:MAG: hypothetical protein ACQEXJ_23670 [Myxococcota bacterium]